MPTFISPYTKKSQNLLQFHVADLSYQFQALPFSIGMAPLKFTRIVKEEKLMLQIRGICILPENTLEISPFYYATIAYHVGLNAVLGWPQGIMANV